MINKAKRIMIIGQPGSGKSTLARLLGEKLGLPVVYIDQIHWCSGWVERSSHEKTSLVSEVHARDSWIFEGGHSATWPERLNRADVLIWLDFPLSVRAWRIFWRTLNYYGKSRPDLPAGCPERFNWEFSLWIWKTRRSNRQNALRLYESVPIGKSKLCLRSQSEVQALLKYSSRV